MLNRYSVVCGCGHELKIEHAGPAEERDTVLVRNMCPVCGATVFGVIAGSAAYKVREDTQTLQMGILNIFVEQAPPMTVRQVYYQCTVKGIVPKTDAGYVKVQKQLTVMRRMGSIPYHWIADSSRYAIRPDVHANATDALQRMQQYYRRDLWQTQAFHVEVWVEKKALIGVLDPICNEFGVTLYPCGGYSSISFAYEAAQELKRHSDQTICVYHLGDFDYDGMHASSALEDELRTHLKVDFEFRRLALSWEQVQRYNLPTRAQKHGSPRRKWFVERYGDLPACELDALPPVLLREMVHNAITSHIDGYEWANMQSIEKEERRGLEVLVSNGLPYR